MRTPKFQCKWCNCAIRKTDEGWKDYKTVREYRLICIDRSYKKRHHEPKETSVVNTILKSYRGR